MTCALFGLAFASAPNLEVLNFAAHYNSTAHFPRGTMSRPKALHLLVGTRFQVCFTPRRGCFSPFPLGTFLYRSLNVFSLGPWSARIRTEFHVLRITWVSLWRTAVFAYGALTLCGPIFQLASAHSCLSYSMEVPQSFPNDPSTP